MKNTTKGAAQSHGDVCIMIGCNRAPTPGSHWCLEHAYKWIAGIIKPNAAQLEELGRGPEIFDPELPAEGQLYMLGHGEWIRKRKQRLRYRRRGVWTQFRAPVCDKCEREIVSTATRCGACQLEYGETNETEALETCANAGRGSAFNQECLRRVPARVMRDVPERGKMCPPCSMRWLWHLKNNPYMIPKG